MSGSITRTTRPPPSRGSPSPDRRAPGSRTGDPVAGVLLGTLVTAVYAGIQHWPAAVPVLALLGGVLATLVVGGVAGAYPAARAARLTSTAALATT